MNGVNDLSRDGDVYVKLSDSREWQRMTDPESWSPIGLLRRMWTIQQHEGVELVTAVGRVPESSGLSGKQFTIYTDTGHVVPTGATLPGVVQLSGLTMRTLTPGLEVGSAHLASAVMTTTDRRVLAGLDISQVGVLDMWIPKEASLAEEWWLGLSEPTREFLAVSQGIEGKVELFYPELLAVGVRVEQSIRWCAGRWPWLF